MFHSLYPFGRQAAVVAALSCLFSAAVHAAPLTEPEVLRQGLSRPELGELSRARLDEVDADAIETRTWANPILEFSHEKVGTSNETSWLISQPIDLSGRRGLRTGATTYRRTAVEAENRARGGERAGELRRAFHAVLHHQDALRAVEDWAARFAEIGTVVDKLARAGEASGYDRRRLLREQRAAEARLAETRAELDRSRARLSALLGQPIDDGVSGRLLPDAPSDLAAQQSRLALRPDLAALAAKAEAANADNSAARRNFPEVTIGIGSKQVNDGSASEKGTMLSVSIPLPFFDRQQAGDRRTAAQAMAARAELGLARRSAEEELRGVHRQLSQLIAAAQHYRRDAVTSSTDLIRIAEASYRSGESNVLELLDAYKGALEAETTALALEWKAREASIELDQLTGNFPQ